MNTPHPMRHAELPQLYCPFLDEVQSTVAAANRHSLEWMDRFGLVDGRTERARFRGSRIGWLAARTTPHATDEFLLVLADWMMWLFAFDDAHSEETTVGSDPQLLAHILTNMLAVLDDPGALAGADDRFVDSLRDIAYRMREFTSDSQLRRFYCSVQAYFFAQLWEASYRAAHAYPGIDEYLAVRVHSGAVPTCMILTDAAGGFEIGEADLARPDVQQLTRMAVNITCWANDIVSFGKEHQRGTYSYNLPELIAHHQGVSAREALESTASMHNNHVREFLRMEAFLLPSAGPDLARYVGGLRSWIRGNLTWSLSSARYQTDLADA